MVRHLQIRLTEEEYQRVWEAAGKTPRGLGPWAKRAVLEKTAMTLRVAEMARSVTEAMSLLTKKGRA